MSYWSACGYCCMCMSVWGIIQLALMGLFFYREHPILIEDAEEHHYDSFEDYINKTRSNYWKTAFNCWCTAGLYVVTLLASIACVVKGNKNEKKLAKRLADEEVVCAILPEPPKPIISKKEADKHKKKERRRPREPRHKKKITT